MNAFRKTVSTHPYLALFSLALLLRLAALVFRLPELETPLNKDSLVYHLLAKNLVGGQGFSQDGAPTARSQPLYPLLLAGIYMLSGGSTLLALLFQSLLGSFTVLYIAGLANLISNRRTAWIAGIIAALYWPFAMASTKLLTETLFIFLLAGAAFHLTAFTRERKPHQAALASLAFGLACLTRGVVLYYALGSGIWLVYRAWKERDRALTLAALSFIALFTAVIIPWAARNKSVFGETLITGSNNGMVLYTGNFPYEGRKFGMNLRTWQLPPDQRYIVDLPEVERDRALKRLAVRRMLKEPGAVAITAVKKALFFWLPVDWEILGKSEGTLNSLYVWVMAFSILWLLRSGERGNFIIPLSLIVYFFLISLVAYGSPRLRLPVEPFLIICAAGGWLVFEKQVRTLWVRGATLAAILALGGVGYVYGFQIKKAGAALMTAIGLW